jgi:ATP-dependent DNA ligase
MANLPQPMLAIALDIEKIPTKAPPGQYYMEAKQDGWRCLVYVRDGEVFMVSRTGKDLAAKVPEGLKGEFVALGGEYTLDGELGYVQDDSEGFSLMTNGLYQHTASVLGSLPDEALRKDKELHDQGYHLGYVAFDLLQAGGYSLIDTPQGARRDMLDQVLTDAHRTGDILDVRWAPVWQAGWDEETYDRLVNDGAEGIMLKNRHATYKEGKRPANHWFKIKKWETLDVIITGYETGQGKYADQVGALHFSLWDSDRGEPGLPVGKCSGMDDVMRQMMTTSWSHYIGKVMEIKYFGKVGKDLRGLRHPQFMRLRPDKDPQECTLD